MLPLKPLDRIARRMGVRRMSHKAVQELASVAEERLLKIAEEAVALAKHAGRKTVLAEDVRLARRRVRF